MGSIILALTSLLLLAFLFVFTGLNKNSTVQQYETSFSLGKVFNICLKVSKEKTTKVLNSDGFPKP